jgi:hypothetical protein
MMDLDKPPRHCWPNSLCEIAEAVGEDVALLLWQNFPGVHVCVPRKLPIEHELIEKMGLAVAERLVGCYGGFTLQIPRAFKGMLVIRNFIIRRESRAGVSNRDLALKFKLGERQVISICTAEGLGDRGRPTAVTQVDLFDE